VASIPECARSSSAARPEPSPRPAVEVDTHPSAFLTPLHPLARSLHPQRLQSGATMAAGAMLCALAAQLQKLLRPTVLLLRPQGHGQGVAMPSLAATVGRPESSFSRLRFVR